MANEPKTARLTLRYDGNVFVWDDFPADKLEELKAIAETLTQPAIVPNMIPQPSSSTQTFREPTTIGSTRRDSLSRFLRNRKDRVTSKPPQ